MDKLKIAKEICVEIESHGFEALIVGGAVRDLLMELEPSDIDITTNMPMSLLEKNFKTYDIGKNKKHSVIIIKKKGISFDAAQYRIDSNASDGRRPDSIEIAKSFIEDSSRRDFTVNSMGLTHDGRIVDHHNGSSDIKNRVIKTVGDPTQRFTEDKLRIIRLARFAAKLDFGIDKDTKKAAKYMAKDIHILAVERIKDEILKAAELGGVKFAKYIQLLDEQKILQEILPEVHALKFKPETKEHHPESNNTFGHILRALENAGNASPLELIGILLHDVGKAVTQDLGAHTAHHTYYNHDIVGIEIVKSIGQRLKFSRKEIEFLVFVTEHHMRFHRIPEMKKSKINKLAESQYFQSLYVVCKADSMGRREYDSIYEFAMDIHANVKEQKVCDLVSGNLVMKLLNLKPGPEVGKIKNVVSERIIELGITDEMEIKQLIKEVGDGYDI